MDDNIFKANNIQKWKFINGKCKFEVEWADRI